MAEIDYIPDHGERAAENLPTAFHDADNVEALTRALAAGVQMLEDQVFDIVVSSYLGTARGDQLDQWGALVGEERGDLRDEQYRVFIKGRILANHAESTPDDLIEIYQELTAPSVVRLWELYPTAYHLTAYRRDPLSGLARRRIRSIMEDAKPLGTEHVLSESPWSKLDNDDDGTLEPGGFSRLL